MQIWEVKFMLSKVADDDKILAEIREQLELHRARTGMSSPVLSDMPKSRTNSTRDLSDYYAQAEALIRAEARVLKERERHIRQALDLIDLAPEPMREPIAEYYVMGLSPKEIAAFGVKSESAIRGIIFRGIRKIAEKASTPAA